MATLHYEFNGLVRSYPKLDVLTWAKKTGHFLPQTRLFLPHVCIFV